MSLKQISNNSEVDERLAALMTNANAIRAIAAAVEGTIGPKGLDTMLVDRFGNVVITNDGATILDLMEANHPAAKMLINVAKAQQEEIGDGTTTATLMAGSMIASGVEQVVKGVPVARIIEGLRVGVKKALALFQEKAVAVTDLNDTCLKQVALVAGREHQDIADLVVEAARLIGPEKLTEHGFKLSDTVISTVGAKNQVILGTLLNKDRMNRQMPRLVETAQILIIDDALEPEKVDDEALATEAGFTRHLELSREFEQNIRKVIQMGINVILTDRGISDLAEEMLTDAGMMAIERVSHRELRRVAEHTGARMIKRTGLKKTPVELQRYIGTAEKVYQDEKLGQIYVIKGGGKPAATIQVGAATEEIVGERQRIAKDAAASVQAAVKSGVIPGGGAIELAAVRAMEGVRQEVRGMAAYGVDCVTEALKKPFTQIVANAGYNPLEKLGDVLSAQADANNHGLAVDCETGDIADMFQLGVIDPTLVKVYALQAAGEVAEAILRIDTIIKMKADEDTKSETGA